MPRSPQSSPAAPPAWARRQRGGWPGLGAWTARRLAGHGVKVALFDLNPELGERVAGEIGGVFCRVDVTSEAEVDAGFARSRGLIGQEGILINCAGTGKP